MVRSCSIKSCTSTQGMAGVKLFAVPKSAIASPEWMNLLKKDRPLNWTPKASTKICSLHFSSNQYRH